MLDNPLVRREFDSIQNAPLGEVFWKVEAIIIANSRRLKVNNVFAIDNLRNYEENFGDEHYVHMDLGYTSFFRFVLPYKDNLQVEIVRSLVDARGIEISGGKQTRRKYVGWLINPPEIKYIKNARGMADDFDNESAQLVPFTMQLMEPVLNTERLTDVAQVYDDITPGELLEHLHGQSVNPNASEATLTSANYAGVRGVDMVRPDNVRRYRSIIVPPDTKLTQLVKRIQEDKGVYSTGINRYFQDGRWFIYPLYNHQRFGEATKRLTIYNFPNDELVAPERSFKVRGKDITILSTGLTTVLNQTEEVAANIGTGLRFVKSGSLIDGMSDASSNKATPNYDTTTQGFSIEEKPTGLTNARLSKRGMTENPFVETSEMMKGMGVLLTCDWSNCMPKYVVPGMPVKFIYEDAGELQEAFGTVLGFRSKEAPDTEFFTDNLYRTDGTLILHLKK
ncbi:hypothetical protein [Vibrio phage vB_VmeM-Yong XC32]|nr:hypothetical protein [Vibrio phage vB_VmeM-Yong XC31]QAX96323.1 hypothetical protein [Vibrio phage vB_VmeM-Yong XC32]QAX96641.1 hypothetical protein [Vibrio phage vB_VmeM-Yong MS31]QAX96959.1 hypothetical protein [Vibrio phage vB_VmeM-Yong MS32]